MAPLGFEKRGTLLIGVGEYRRFDKYLHKTLKPGDNLHPFGNSEMVRPCICTGTDMYTNSLNRIRNGLGAFYPDLLL